MMPMNITPDQRLLLQELITKYKELGALIEQVEFILNAAPPAPSKPRFPRGR